MTNEETVRLVGQASSGDEHAFEELFQEFSKTSYYVALKMLKDETEAEDVVQETAIQVYSKLNTLKDPATFFGWVKMITSNICKRRLEKHKAVLFAPADAEDDETGLEDFTPDYDDGSVPHEVFDNKETRRMIRDLIDDLPDDQKLVIYMYYFQNLNSREIAESLGVSESTIKSRLKYAKQKIETGVRGYEKDGVKLYSVAPWLIVAALAEGVKGVSMPAMVVSVSSIATVGAEGVAAGAAGAEGVAAGTAGAEGAAAGFVAEKSASALTSFLATTTGKVAAAVTALAVAAGGYAFASEQIRSRREAVDPEPEVVVVEEPEEEPFEFRLELNQELNENGAIELEYVTGSISGESFLSSYTGTLSFEGAKRVDTSKVGMQTLVYVLSETRPSGKVEQQSFPVKFEIVDTTPPEIRLKNETVYESVYGYDPISNIDAVFDKVDGRLDWAEDKDSIGEKGGWCIIDYRKIYRVGRFEFTVYAKDRHGNESEISFIVNSLK